MDSRADKHGVKEDTAIHNYLGWVSCKAQALPVSRAGTTVTQLSAAMVLPTKQKAFLKFSSRNSSKKIADMWVVRIQQSRLKTRLFETYCLTKFLLPRIEAQNDGFNSSFANLHNPDSIWKERTMLSNNGYCTAGLHGSGEIEDTTKNHILLLEEVLQVNNREKTCAVTGRHLSGEHCMIIACRVRNLNS